MLNEETNLKKNSRMQQQMTTTSVTNQTPPPSILYPSPAPSIQTNAQLHHPHPQHPHLLNPMSMLSQMSGAHHLPQIIPPSSSNQSSSSSRPGPIPSPLQQQQQHLILGAGGSTPKPNPSPFNPMALDGGSNGNTSANKPQSPFHPPQPPMSHPLSSPSPNQPNCKFLFIDDDTIEFNKRRYFLKIYTLNMLFIINGIILNKR